MNDNQERPIRMMAVYAGDQGFYLALVPTVVTEERMEAALHELGVDAQAVFELNGWTSTEDNVTVAHVPALEER